MATRSHVLAWGIPRTGELGGLQSMGSQSLTQLKQLSSSSSSSLPFKMKVMESIRIFQFHILAL